MAGYLGDMFATSIKKEIGDVLESVYEKDYVKVGTGDNVGGAITSHLEEQAFGLQ